ncbi:MAG TPA: glutathione S-transferase N-terminal domain-containing protein [Solirubrobacteraceae bacterium]|jgi:glutathione S-transferase|nr:glutathione S-transferase N-terminal domain-containing protein [Solirubrobacteraceae bacterium]
MPIVSAVATLYRCNTPTNWLCPCGRVARALRRDGIEFDVVVVPQRRSRRPEVVALSGQKRVPLLVLDGEVICDSRRIVQQLELRRAGVAALTKRRSSSDSAQDRRR